VVSALTQNIQNLDIAAKNRDGMLSPNNTSNSRINSTPNYPAQYNEVRNVLQTALMV